MGNRGPQSRGNPARGELSGSTGVRTSPVIHEMDGQKFILVEPDGRDIVEIDDTSGKRGY